MYKTRVRSLCWEDTLEKEMATHSSAPAWRIPRTEEPGGLQSMGSQGVRHNWETKHSSTHVHKNGKVTSVSVQFSRSGVSDSVQPHGPQHARPPCSSPTPGVYPSSCPLSQWCHPTISSSVVPFSSCPQSFPASGSFLVSQLFAWGGQIIGVSASTSVPPMNIRDWFSLGWTARRSNQSILKEMSPGCSLEGLMLKLKLQYFGHLVRRADSLEKTLMLAGIGGRKRRGRQRMRCCNQSCTYCLYGYLF